MLETYRRDLILSPFKCDDLTSSPEGPAGSRSGEDEFLYLYVDVRITSFPFSIFLKVISSLKDNCNAFLNIT